MNTILGFWITRNVITLALQYKCGTNRALQVSKINHMAKDKEVEVFINGKEKEILKGKYVVSDLKTALGVPADDELAAIRGKESVALKDDETIEVHEGEKFVSHKRRGGSS